MLRFNCVIFLLSLSAFSVNGNSLYNASNYQALHEDKKAYRVGDSITILIFENAQANSSAGEGSRSDFLFAGGASVDERNWSAGLNLNAANDGEASTNRNGFVKAQITVAVIGIDHQNMLIVEGEQHVTVNEESQIIQVAGKVRPEDVSSHNTVPSFRIQNAQISIDGDGSVSNGKNSNLLTRLVTWLGF